MIPNGVLRGSTVGFLIELFEKNTRTPSGISGVLNEYYNLVKNIDTTTQDIFGAENPSKVAELRAAYQKYSTSLIEEPNVSWRDTGEPTDAEKWDDNIEEIPISKRLTNGNPDIRWSIREDSEAEKINRQFRELYDRYKGGDQAAYEEAAKMVAEYAESKGYDVMVYHGTGADGFNVAKADASEAQNGEGAQAHGMGLYLATENARLRDTETAPQCRNDTL